METIERGWIEFVVDEKRRFFSRGVNNKEKKEKTVHCLVRKREDEEWRRSEAIEHESAINTTTSERICLGKGIRNDTKLHSVEKGRKRGSNHLETGTFPRIILSLIWRMEYVSANRSRLASILALNTS